MILTVLKTSNQQLWFTIQLRLGKIYLDSENFKELDRLIDTLKFNSRKTHDDDGDSNMNGATSNDYDTSKSHLVLETFALEI